MPSLLPHRIRKMSEDFSDPGKDFAHCKDCVSSLKSKKHPCSRHARCFRSSTNLWDPSLCKFCLDLFDKAEATSDNCEEKRFLTYFARRASHGSPDKPLFSSPSLGQKFGKKWLGKIVDQGQ